MPNNDDLNSKIILAKNVKIDREMKNVLDYTPAQMITLLSDSTHFVAQDNHYSFIRNTGAIQTEFNYDDALKSNYIAFQNYDYSQKWFFAWIDEVIWKGEKNTEIRYTVDSFTTFNKDLTYEDCYVLREHVNDDTVGVNTIPENIDIGDVIQEGDTEFITELVSGNFYVALEVNARPKDNSDDNGGYLKFTGAKVFNKLYNGHDIIIIKSGNDLNCFLHRMNMDSLIDSVFNLFIVPSCLFRETGLVQDLGQHFAYTTFSGAEEHSVFYFYTIAENTYVPTINLNVAKTTSFTGYTNIRNNKLKCYPYNYLLVSNNVGQTNVFKYEEFNTSGSPNVCQFDLVGILTIGGSFKLIPRYYKNINKNYDESLPLAKYPTCSWSSDAYTAWLTQNAANEYASAGTSIVSGALTGAATGGAAGAAIGAGISAISEIMGLNYTFDKAKLLPPNVVGSNTGSVTWAIDGVNFFFRHMHCKPEYLRIIDDYFTRFGYRINRVKTPNITGRQYFNYVEIASSDDVATGSIPNKYMDEINKAFRKGITIWHDHSKIGDYSVTNSIVT